MGVRVRVRFSVDPLEYHAAGVLTLGKMKMINIEKADLAKKDAELVSELEGWLQAYDWEVRSCGHDGELEMEKIREYARKVIKSLANYI